MRYKNFTITAAVLLTVVFSFFIFEIHPAAADKPKLIALYVQNTSGKYDKAKLVFNPNFQRLPQSVLQAAIHLTLTENSLKQASTYILSAQRSPAAMAAL